MEHVTPAGAELIEHCAQQLAAAHRAGQATAQPDIFSGLTPEQAAHVQRRVMGLLGQDATTCKVGISPEGAGLCAPIFGSTCGTNSFAFDRPASGFLGIEVEIAARLSRDITPDLARQGPDAVLDAIASFHVGVELVGTRITDRHAAGALAQLADNINTCGYVHSDQPFGPGPDLSGAMVDILIDGKALGRKPAICGFGSILAPILAVGLTEHRPFDGLKAGMLVTTGALSGLVPIVQPGLIQAGLAGFDLIEITLR